MLTQQLTQHVLNRIRDTRKLTLTNFTLNRTSLYKAYLGWVSLCGIILLTWSVGQIPHFEAQGNFLLLALLAVISATVTTSVSVEKSSITYSVNGTIAMAAVPYWGVEAAIFILALANVALWLIKPSDKGWKKSGWQLAFNMGMSALSVALASSFFLAFTQWLGETTYLARTVPWLLSAYLFEEINLWLLLLVLRLQHGDSIRPLEMWKQDLWATQIGTLVTAAGGWVLSYSVGAYGPIGIVIFFLPILLSAYAFRLYVHQMKTHLDNLEQIVAERTKELAKKTDELTTLNQHKDAFLSVLSHDMMTPLGNIRFCLEFMQEDEELSDESREFVDLAMRSQHMLYHLARNVVDLEKLRVVGTLSMKKETFDVGATLKQLVDMMQFEAKGKSICLQLHLMQSALSIHADQQQIERVLLNLISNAVKYTPPQGVVQVKGTIEDACIVVEVADTGYGIPADELPYIFERFRRVKQNEDKAHGTGLGLAITKALIEHHNGSINVTSERGKGSLFTVRLPVQG